MAFDSAHARMELEQDRDGKTMAQWREIVAQLDEEDLLLLAAHLAGVVVWTVANMNARLAGFTKDIAFELPVLCNPPFDDGAGGMTLSERWRDQCGGLTDEIATLLGHADVVIAEQRRRNLAGLPGA